MDNDPLRTVTIFSIFHLNVIMRSKVPTTMSGSYYIVINPELTTVLGGLL